MALRSTIASFACCQTLILITNIFGCKYGWKTLTSNKSLLRDPCSTGISRKAATNASLYSSFVLPSKADITLSLILSTSCATSSKPHSHSRRNAKLSRQLQTVRNLSTFKRTLCASLNLPPLYLSYVVVFSFVFTIYRYK